MCQNQIGRRNISDEQKTYLLGKLYEARKNTVGAADGFRGNQYSKVVTGTFIFVCIEPQAGHFLDIAILLTIF